MTFFLKIVNDKKKNCLYKTDENIKFARKTRFL